MPSCMIHIAAAVECNQEIPERFLIGSIAPDAITMDFKTKDLTHLRNIEDDCERLEALKKYALSIDMNDYFYAGAILHLYLDCLWDSSALREFKNMNNNDVNLWFHPYRNEISIASEWIYHTCGWSQRAFKKMLEYDVSKCPPLKYISNGDIEDYIIRNYKWHEENSRGPSKIYTPEYVSEFTKKAVSGFREMMAEIHVSIY